jgi:death-on-curing family protein
VEIYGEPMPAFQLRGQEGLELFESAVNNPRQPYFRTVHEKAAALFRSLIKSHPLVDGNKRVACLAVLVFLRVNGVDFKVDRDAVVEAALEVANYEGNFPLDWITRWIRVNCTGRPRSLVSAVASSWPLERQRFLYEARRNDIREGRRPRVPGRRVRLSKGFWEGARQLELGIANGKGRGSRRQRPDA